MTNVGYQAWESDLKCHALYGKKEDRNKLQTSKSHFANSPLGHPKDWERVWAAVCDKYVESIVRCRHSLFLSNDLFNA